MLVLGDDLDLAYAETGDPNGVPLVLLHGYADSHRFFDPLVPHLGAGLRILALTQRGHGDSGKPDDGYDLPTLAGDVVGALDALGVTRAVLVGHSSGGLVAQQVARDHPSASSARCWSGRRRICAGCGRPSPTSLSR